MSMHLRSRRSLDIWESNGKELESLWNAAHSGDIDTVVELLLSDRCSGLVNSFRPYDHTTPLWAAAAHGHEVG